MALRGGRYELLGTIAAGGMATVHLGRVLGAGGFERLVAIKTMHPHLAREAEFVAMFLDEARLAARIRHPNVVATLDIQQDAEGLFLVMEYVEGPSLSRLLKALAASRLRDVRPWPPLPLDVALRIFTDTLAGLHAAHELTGPDGEPLRLIHRDMSPHNVLVGSDGIARITDFGVARAESRLASTRTGSVKGKVMYMAPEQVKSLPIDRRADIYAAGAVLWEMLTGERLVRADSDLAAMRMIVESERQSPREVEATVPEEIAAATMRALAPDPSLRYPTAAAFSEALEGAASACGVSIAAPRVVAQYVRSLGLHSPPVTPPSSPDGPVSSRSHAAPGQPSSGGLSHATSASLSHAASGQPSSGSLSPATPGQPSHAAGDPFHAADTGPTSVDSTGGARAVSAASRVDTTPASIGTHGAFAAQAPAGPPGHRSRTGILVAAVSAAVLGAAVAFYVVTGSGPATVDPTQAAASAQPVTSTSSPPAVVPASPLPPPPSTAAPSATGPASAQTRDVRPSVPGTAAPRATAGPKAFRPKEL